MAEARVFDTAPALIHFLETRPDYGSAPRDIRTEADFPFPDDRIGWAETHIVTAYDPFGQMRYVLGFTDAPINGESA